MLWFGRVVVEVSKLLVILGSPGADGLAEVFGLKELAGKSQVGDICLKDFRAGSGAGVGNAPAK